MFTMPAADALSQARGDVLRDAEKRMGTAKMWGETFTWIDYSAKVEGQLCSLEVFDHPGNPNHPTYWKAQGDRVPAANPVDERDH